MRNLKNHLAGIALLSVSICLPFAANATTLSFDGLAELVVIPNGYNDLNWNDFITVDPSKAEGISNPNSDVLPKNLNVIVNAHSGSPAEFSSLTPITFNSVYLTSVILNSLSVKVTGYLGNTETETATFTLDTSQATLANLNWINVDKVVFQASGGTGANPVETLLTQYFAADNLTINEPVPPPPYIFSGFQPPVNTAPVINIGKAGRTYPVKWQLKDQDDAFVSALTAVKSVNYMPTQCGAFATSPVDALDTGGTGDTMLRYDTDANQFIYNWKTPAEALCYTLFLTLDSGQVFTAYFNLAK